MVQQGRTSATKGLLHDFSNVMVGLCSISENALDDAEPGTPLRDDMEIIRDSAVRAHQLIRRIAQLNSADVQPPSLIDLCEWLRNEVETIRATLPKGSNVVVPDKGRSVLINVSESRLRDFILMLVAGVSLHHSRGRVAMHVEVAERGPDCAITIRFAEAGSDVAGSMDAAFLPATILSELALSLNATCQSSSDDGRAVIVLTLRGA
ncbi:MAG TPA: hypothetical protein PKI32_02140 [Opitutales bacterium]|nr:hypothetical protein [Opitutales bacterium]